MSSQSFIESRKTIFFVYRQEDSQSARQIYDRLICNWVFWDSALIDVVSAFPGADLRLLFEQQPRFILLVIVGPELEGNECQEGAEEMTDEEKQIRAARKAGSDFVKIGTEYALERKEDVRVGAIFLQNASPLIHPLDPRSPSWVREQAYAFAYMRSERSLSVNDLDEDDARELDRFVSRILMGGWEAPKMMFSGAGPPDPNDCRLRVEAEISEEYARALASRHTECRREEENRSAHEEEEDLRREKEMVEMMKQIRRGPACAGAPLSDYVEDFAAEVIDKDQPPMSRRLRTAFKDYTEYVDPLESHDACQVSAQTDQVNFSAMAQGQLEAGAQFILDIWAHTESQTKQVKELANELGRSDLKGTKQGIGIEQGNVFVVHLNLPDFEVADPVDLLTWNGDPVNASFPVTVHKDCTEGSHLGTATISSHGLMICKLHFQIEIGVGARAASEDLTIKTERPRTAFASYSSQDWAEVRTIIQGMEKAAIWLNVAVDKTALRSGQKYREVLERLIPDNDIFYLFWSKPASLSKEVEWEWRVALDRRGIEFIDPVPLVDPQQVPPPPELSSLHFNDKWLAFKK